MYFPLIDLLFTLSSLALPHTVSAIPFTPLSVDAIVRAEPLSGRAETNAFQCMAIAYSYSCTTSTSYTITGICGFQPVIKTCKTGLVCDGGSGPINSPDMFNPCVTGTSGTAPVVKSSSAAATKTVVKTTTKTSATKARGHHH